jgi:hypothetical protein
MRRSHSAVLSVAGLLFAAVASAQRPTATVSGKVRDSSGQPIPGAEVTVFSTQLKATTTDSGTFMVAGVPAGKYWIGVRRLGFEPLAFTVTLKGDEKRDVGVELEPLPHGLSEVKVRARSNFGRRYDDFNRRKSSAWGNFITRDDIDKRRPYSVSSLVSFYFPGVSHNELDWPSSIYSDAFGRQASYGSRYGGCAPAVSVNGGMPMQGWGLGTFDPDQLEAVEVYKGRSMRIPIEFQGFGGTGCGLVVLWLR